MQIVNPIDFPNWDSMLLACGDQSFFHSSAWAKTLADSYGFRPRYFADYSGDGLSFLMPFMEVNSFITGRRGVSLPFSDQCQPFALNCEFIPQAIERVLEFARRAGWEYAEWRDAPFSAEEAAAYERFYVHEIDLCRDEALIYSSFRDSNRRSIRKALKAGVSVKPCDSLEAVRLFYGLNCITRKRHGLPPQPYAFFKNLYQNVIQKGLGSVFIASHGGRALAAAIFVFFGSHGIYKYGASDMRYQNLRPNNLLFWEAIRWLKERGITILNLGRTELENQGLLQYKRLWGGTEQLVDYKRYHLRKGKFVQRRQTKTHFQNHISACLPIGVLRIIGAISYKHVG